MSHCSGMNTFDKLEGGDDNDGVELSSNEKITSPLVPEGLSEDVKNGQKPDTGSKNIQDDTASKPASKPTAYMTILKYLEMVGLDLDCLSVGLVLRWLNVIVYYVVGCLCFNHFEGWNVLECCYYITVTVTTVGYGDYSPSSTGGKIFAIFYILYGLSVIFQIIAGLVISVASKLQKSTVEAVQAVMDDDDDVESLSDKYNAQYSRFAYSVFSIIFMIFVSALFFKVDGEFRDNPCDDDGACEGGRLVLNAGDDWVNCIWLAFQTVTTVGYGDLSIEKDSGKVFLIFFIWLSVIVVSVSVGNIGSVVHNIREEERKYKILSSIDFAQIENFDKDGNGVTLYEFTIGMLTLLEGDEALNRKIADVMKLFRQHDVDMSGKLDKNDLKRIVALKEEELKRRKQQQEKTAKSKILRRTRPGNRKVHPPKEAGEEGNSDREVVQPYVQNASEPPSPLPAEVAS